MFFVINFFIKILVFLSLCSCNLRPLYHQYLIKDNAEYNSILYQLSLIKVEIESDIDITDLSDLLHMLEVNLKSRKCESKFLLKLRINSSKNLSVLSKKSSILRRSISLSTDYELLDIKEQNILTKGVFTVFSSFGVISSPYSSIVEEEKSFYLLNKSLVEEIKARLILFFKIWKKSDSVSQY